MNLTDRIIRNQLELIKPLYNGSKIESARSLQDKIGAYMHFTRRRDVVTMDRYNNNERLSLLVPRDEVRGGVILYVHGGGYTCGNMDYAKGFAALLCAECGMRVLCVDYRLAPENPYPAGLNDVVDAYRALLNCGTPADKIILCGESAGGGMIYALCLALKEMGLPLPAGNIAISPWCDLTLSGESYENNHEADPSLTRERLDFFAECYVGPGNLDASSDTKMQNHVRNAGSEQLRREPKVSPIFGDLKGLPPSLIFVGEDEILLSDSLTMKDRLVEAGCSVTLYSRPEMWHVYVLYNLKSNRREFDRINDFIKHRLPGTNERKLRWMHLDNAGKMYPAAATGRWNNCFRVSATLKENVDKDILQSALDVTVRRFPSIAVAVRKGAFWYHLREIARAPKVQDEKSHPLTRMPMSEIKECAFRVLVYKKRIAVEFFHAITDGNGGLIFLKSLVAEYLAQRYGAVIPNTHGVLDRLEEPTEEEIEDCFLRCKAPGGKKRMESGAYRIYGVRETDGFCHVTTFTTDTEELLRRSREKGITLTAYLVSVFIKACIDLQNKEQPNIKRQKKVKMLIPCDLRRLFGTKTLRNFALYSTAGVDPRLGEYTFDEICDIVHHRMCLDITKKGMAARIYTNVHNEEQMIMKIMPLFIKNIAIKTVFNLVAERTSCLSVSNLGRVTVPEAMNEYIDRFDFILGVQSNAPYNAGIVTWDNTLYLNIIRNIKEPRLERSLYQAFRDLGIKVKVESNQRY